MKNNLPDLKTELMPIQKPEEVINAGIQTAKALKLLIIDSKKDRATYGKEKKIHIEFSEYQALGKWYGIAVKTYEDGEVERFGARGIKAHGEAVHMETGEIVGYAEALCFKNEPGRGGHTWNQIGSMAQTRAGSKALRNAVGWVVELAGLPSTPAEEMDSMRNKEDVTQEAINRAKEQEQERGEEKQESGETGNAVEEEEGDSEEETQDEEVQKKEEEAEDTNEEREKIPETEQLDDTDDLTKAELHEMTAEEIGKWAVKKLRKEEKDITGAEIGKILMAYNRKRWLSTRKFNKVKEWFINEWMTG